MLSVPLNRILGSTPASRFVVCPVPIDDFCREILQAEYHYSTAAGAGVAVQSPSPSCRLAIPGHASCLFSIVGSASASEAQTRSAVKNRIVVGVDLCYKKECIFENVKILKLILALRMIVSCTFCMLLHPIRGLIHDPNSGRQSIKH